ncbi:hypothetical protein NE865_10987 [Phthorimaea operculella]|nr:hypothetical protein NE865_10987 [Phthorimaea operculella]
MVKIVLLVAVIAAAFIADSTGQRYIQPTFRPPLRPPLVLPTFRPSPHRPMVMRTVREANDEPQWLWQGEDVQRAPSTADHPFLPSDIDDVKLDPHRRYARSKDSPSAKGYGGGRSSSGNRGDTGPTHPGHNRRNARSIRRSSFDDPWPQPWRPRVPKPYDPFNPRPGHPRRPLPIYARSTRDIQFPGIKKPSHRDVIIPNWNPHVRTNPWNSLGGRRKTRSLGNPGKEHELYQDYYDVLRQEE